MGLGDFVSGLTNAAEDGVSYVYHGVAGGENRADSRSRQDGYEQAQQQGNAARDKIYAEQHRLQREILAGTDPTSIDGKDNWDSWSHKAIKSMTDNLNSGQIHAAARGWSSVGGKVATDVADFQNVMKQTIGANWEGDAATEAQQSASAYSQQAEGFGHAIDLTGTKVSEAATGAEQTRNMMPPPKDFSFREAAISSLANPIAGANDIFQQKQAQNAAHAEAVRVMNTVYTPVYVQSDSGVPTFTAPTAMPGTGVAPAPSPPPVVASPPPPPSTRPSVGSDQRRGPGAGGNNGQWSSPAGVNAPGDHTPAGSVAGAGAAGTDGPGSSVGGPGHGGPVYPGDGGRAGAGAGSNSPGAGVAAGGSPGDGTGDGGYSGADTGGFGNVAASNFAPDPTMSPGSLGGPAGGSAGVTSLGVTALGVTAPAAMEQVAASAQVASERSVTGRVEQLATRVRASAPRVPVARQGMGPGRPAVPGETPAAAPWVVEPPAVWGAARAPRPRQARLGAPGVRHRQAVGVPAGWAAWAEVVARVTTTTSTTRPAISSRKSTARRSSVSCRWCRHQ